MFGLKKVKFFRGILVALVISFVAVIPAMGHPDTVHAENAKVKFTVEYRQSVARNQINPINNWRAGSTWYYNVQNQKVYLNGLKALKYDYTLEKYAMQRAAEIALSFDHIRPNGLKKEPGLAKYGYIGTGENIAISQSPKAADAVVAFDIFKEENELHNGQGHRRNMLSVSYDWDCMAVSCAVYKGTYFWVQIFGLTKNPDTTVTTPVNGSRTMTIEVDPAQLTKKSADLSALNNWDARINKGETDYLPKVILNLATVETWPFNPLPVTAVPTWTSSNTSVATVDSNTGTIKGVNSGTSNITMRESLTNTSKTVSFSVTDPSAITGVSLDKTSMSLAPDSTYTLSATVTPSTAANKSVTWSSSNTSVATVSSSGVVRAVKAGTATITAKTVSGNKTASCKVTVSDVMPTSVSLDKTSLTLSAGSTDTLIPTVMPSNATNKNVTWSSSDTSVATVSSGGVVKGVGAGRAVITARTASGNKTATCNVTVTQPVTRITLNRKSVSLMPGETSGLTATASPDNATDKSITWSTDRKSVATVDSNGKVKGVSPGTAVITAADKSGNVKATCTVRVLFNDVISPSLWYYTPVYWAVDEGIATGSNGYFSPASNCTREQAVTFLWRLAGKPEPKSMNSKFSDVKNTKSYSYKAIMWASENNVVTGSKGKFNPKGTCTREQIVTIIWRIAGKPEPSSMVSKFTDVQNKKS